MNIDILTKLKEWRDETAKREGVENYRVITNSAIEEIARSLPSCKDELTRIKGIKDKKFYKYGKDIFSVIKNANGKASVSADGFRDLFSESRANFRNKREISLQDPDKIFSVSDYLSLLNEKLSASGRARIKGEVTSIDKRDRVVYFSLKDPSDESVINCLIFKNNYDMSGVEMEVGEEVIITAISEIYKPTGRLSMKASLIEISGEGSLKKAYDELKKKLEREGIFSPERKRFIPKLPKVIGLITSNQGAAMGDFMTNIGNYGFKIKLINSSVEGKQAIFDLLNAIKTAKQTKDLEVLAIVRGGGSLESLQAFNSEILVRELIKLNIPVVCGVGHEKDISLMSLASDVSVSTPTAAAFAIRKSWDDAVREIEFSKDTIVDAFRNTLSKNRYSLEKNIKYGILSGLNAIINKFDKIIDDISSCEDRISSQIANNKKHLEMFRKNIYNEYDKILFYSKECIRNLESAVMLNDPNRQLARGYSISYVNKKIIRSIKCISNKDVMKTRLIDGTIDSIVEKITGHK